MECLFLSSQHFTFLSLELCSSSCSLGWSSSAIAVSMNIQKVQLSHASMNGQVKPVFMPIR